MNFFRHIALSAAVLLICGLAFGQQQTTTAAVDSSDYSNPYKIHNSLFDIYRQAQRLRSSEKCLPIGDSMRLAAIAIGDKKAECLALSVPVQYYQGKKDFEHLLSAIDTLCAVSRKNGYPQYYYFGKSNEITYLLSKGKTLTAKDKIDLMHEEAVADDYPYAISLCYTQTGNFYQSRSLYKQAFNNYLKAAEYIETYVPDQSPAGNYLQCCESSLRLENFKNAAYFAEKGLQFYGAPNVKSSLLDHLAYSNYKLGNYAEFLNAYKQLEELTRKEGKNLRKSLLYADVAYYCYRKDYQDAVKSVETNMTGLVKHLVLAGIYKESGDYYRALAETDTIYRKSATAYNEIMDSDMAEMTARFDNQRLMSENEKLQYEQQISKDKFRTRMLVIALIAALLVFAVAGLFIYASYKRNLRHMKEAEDERYNFLINVSHELRTPLTLISGPLSSILKKPALEDKDMVRLRNINIQASRMNDLLNTILTTNKVRAGKTIPEMKEEPFNIWVHKSVEAFADQAAIYNSQLLYAFDERISKVNMDSKLCLIVLSNIMMNALKHNNPGKPISIRTSIEDGKMARVAVSDCGSGIGDINTAKLFEQYYTKTEDKSGFGIGLAYSKTIVDSHNGLIGAYNNPSGVGATFWFELPLS